MYIFVRNKDIYFFIKTIETINDVLFVQIIVEYKRIPLSLVVGKQEQFLRFLTKNYQFDTKIIFDFF